MRKRPDKDLPRSSPRKNNCLVFHDHSSITAPKNQSQTRSQWSQFGPNSGFSFPRKSYSHPWK
jgi:hypothetical protein